MNFLDILKSIEQAIYEIALWLILIPITIFKILARPAAVPEYIRAELMKEDKKQFQDRMSPLMLWLLMVVVPGYMFIKYFYPDLPAYLTAKPENYLFYIAITCVSILLTPALLIHALQRKKFDRESFKESFYVQCYIQAPVSFLLILLIGTMKYNHFNFDAFDQDSYIPFFNKMNGWKDIFLVPFAGLFLFLAFLEIKLIMKTGRSVSTAIGLVVLCLFIVGFVMIAAAGLSYVLFYGL